MSCLSDSQLVSIDCDAVGERRVRWGMLRTGSSFVGSEDEWWKVAPLDNDILRGRHSGDEGGEREVMSRLERR